MADLGRADLGEADLGERYPVLLDLRGKRVLAVGGGPVSARRVAGLVAARARVTVIAPWVCEDLAAMIDSKQVDWLPRDFAATDLADAGPRPDPVWLVHTATGDAATDSLVAELAGELRIWAIRADDAAASAAWVPAVARDPSGITVAVSSQADPGRARAVRDAVAAQLADGSLGVRRSARRADAGPVPGRVALVGGGPGHPDLITVRGRRLLAAADVIVTDRLGPTSLLDELMAARGAGEVQVINVGKLPGNHPVPQAEINRILVENALRGALVVRLKGGDPFVLGRGGEEALYCAEHGVAVEVVPGVTSAVSVPAAAGIPVTHRGITTSFVVASAHAGGQAASVAAHAAPPDATLVLLMGVSALAQTVADLIAAGRPATTPAAVIADGWLPSQEVVTGTLADIAGLVQDRGFAGRPAVIVVGEVVAVGAALQDLGALVGIPR